MTIVHELISQAARTGADAIEVEYKDRCEEVVAMRGPFGFGIASLRNSDAKAEALRRELYRMAKRRTAVTVDGIDYDVRVCIYDSFGEDAFRVEFTRAKEGPNHPAAAAGGLEAGFQRCAPPLIRGRSAGQSVCAKRSVSHSIRSWTRYANRFTSQASTASR